MQNGGMYSVHRATQREIYIYIEREQIKNIKIKTFFQEYADYQMELSFKYVNRIADRSQFNSLSHRLSNRELSLPRPCLTTRTSAFSSAQRQEEGRLLAPVGSCMERFKQFLFSTFLCSEGSAKNDLLCASKERTAGHD